MSEERSLSKIPKVGIKRVTTKLQTPFPGGEREFSPFLGMLKAEKRKRDKSSRHHPKKVGVDCEP